MNDLAKQYPIYLNFQDDKLAIDSATLQECCSQEGLNGGPKVFFKGLENVQSVIILNPIKTTFRQRGSMYDVLQLFPRASKIHVECVVETVDTRHRGTAITLNPIKESDLREFDSKDLSVWSEQLKFIYGKIGREAEPIVDLIETSFLEFDDSYASGTDRMVFHHTANPQNPLHRHSIRPEDILDFLVGQGVEGFEEELANLCERWRTIYDWSWHMSWY